MNQQVDLYDKEFGKASLPLMLVHGFPLDNTIWDEVVAHMQNDTRLLLPDLRGYGQSPVPKEGYTMEAMAGDLKILLDRLEIERVVLAGHSMGGYISLAFAEAYPDRLAGLAMVNSSAAADAPDRKAGRYQLADEIDRTGVGVLENSLERYSPSAEVRERVREWMRRSSAVAVQGSLRGMADRPDRLAVLAGLHIPVAVITGDHDILIPVDRSREMVESTIDGRLTILQACGHMSMLEAPALTAGALRDFNGALLK